MFGGIDGGMDGGMDDAVWRVPDNSGMDGGGCKLSGSF